MFRAAHLMLMPLLLAGWLLASATAAAVTPTPRIQDHAGLFSPDAVARAERLLDDVWREEHKELVIETFAGVPADKAKAVAGMYLTQRNNFFTDWAKQRAQDEGVDGAYVLICVNPSHKVVVLGPGTPDAAFPEAARTDLLARLTLRGGKGQHDEDLLDAVTALQHNLHQTPPPPPASWSWLVVIGVILGLLVVWGIIHVAHRILVLRGHHAEAAETAAADALPPLPPGPKAEPEDYVLSPDEGDPSISGGGDREERHDDH